MAATFSRTVRSLEGPAGCRRGAALLGTTVLVLWAGWFLFGRITVYEVSDKGRLEVKSTAHTVAALLPGQVVETHLAIGREVHAGEVLVVLDAEAERLAVRERETRREGLHARLQALQQEIRAEQEAMEVQREARATALKASRAQVAAAESRAAYADRQVDMLNQLRAQKAASTEELRKAMAEVEARHLGVRVLQLETTRLEQDRIIQESDRQVRLAKLDRDAADLAGEISGQEAAIRRLEHDADLRVIRAPVSGRLGEVIEHPVGSVVQAAEKFGAIVPPGEPRAVTQFPVAAVGRLRPGQPARLRLEGFPWTQYGMVGARVAEVGNEASAGLIRVEFSLDPNQTAPVPLEHGLPCSAEVDVEQVSPAVLVLRAAGQLLATRRLGGAQEHRP
jgi:membrane fusion protein (multidrug efflux system)